MATLVLSPMAGVIIRDVGTSFENQFLKQKVKMQQEQTGINLSLWQHF